MKYKKGQIFLIEHIRKGTFYCQATEDFDTDTTEFYPLCDLDDNEGFACRRTFCKLTPISTEEFVKVGIYFCTSKSP